MNLEGIWGARRLEQSKASPKSVQRKIYGRGIWFIHTWRRCEPSCILIRPGRALQAGRAPSVSSIKQQRWGKSPAKLTIYKIKLARCITYNAKRSLIFYVVLAAHILAKDFTCVDVAACCVHINQKLRSLLERWGDRIILILINEYAFTFNMV